MRFWDSSAVIPLLLDQGLSTLSRAWLRDDPSVAAWWGTPVECVSAIARLRRAGLLSMGDEVAAQRVLDRLQQAWVEITPADGVRRQAARLLRVHPLRAADALQLAAALVWASGEPHGLAVATADRRLADAARLEGFTLLTPWEPGSVPSEA